MTFVKQRGRKFCKELSYKSCTERDFRSIGRGPKRSSLKTLPLSRTCVTQPRESL